MTKLIDAGDTVQEFVGWLPTWNMMSGEYHTHANETHPYVMRKLREYIGTGKYPYNADVERFILAECESVDAEKLGWLVYQAQGFLDEERENKYTAKMLFDGWSILTIQKGRDFVGKKILLHKRSESLLGGSTKDIICKSLAYKDDVILFPPRCSRSGYSVMQISHPAEKNQFFKILN